MSEPSSFEGQGSSPFNDTKCGGWRWDSGGDCWLDMDMWHSMLALEGVALCVILIFFNDIFVKLGTTFWSLALC